MARPTGNLVRFEGNTAIVELKKGKLGGVVTGRVLLDPEDVLKLKSWTVTRDGRYPSVHRRVDGRKERMLLRLLLWDGKPPKQIEHINGDRYDCRKSNMRPRYHGGLRNDVRVDGSVAYVLVGDKVDGATKREFMIDASDVEKLRSFRWGIDGRGYVIGYRGHAKKRKRVILHRILMGALPGFEVDHENHDRQDNRRANLRIATHSENMSNQKGLQAHNTSGYNGVSFHKLTNKWRARTKVNYQEIYLGLFNTPEDAARAYNKAAKQHHGDFASLNGLP